MKHSQIYGIGLESEGFIVERGTRKAVPRINGISSYEWIEKEVLRKYPALRQNISPEQASVMLELKTQAYADDGEKSILEIQNVRNHINELLASVGAELIMVPVLPESFEFIPATSEPGSRSSELVASWGSTSQGKELLYSTAIASLQVNNSKPFDGMSDEADGLEIGRQLHNQMSREFPRLNQENDPSIKDSRGLTRMDNLKKLLISVKEDGYRNTKYSSGEILIPPTFQSVADMQAWMMAQSNVQHFHEAQCKNEHALTMKLKRPAHKESEGVWAAESRVFDAVDTPADMRRLIRIFDAVTSRVTAQL